MAHSLQGERVGGNPISVVNEEYKGEIEMDAWNLRGGQLKILKQNEIEEIHQRALDVLQQVGCFMDHEEALAVFEKHGAVVDHSTRIVKIPRNLVEEALRLSPSSVLLA